MRKVLLAVAVVGLAMAVAVNASAYTRSVAKADVSGAPYGLSADCTLDAYNICSNWIWIWTDIEGALWGNVFDPADCDPACTPYSSVQEVTMYMRCQYAPAPGTLNGLGVWTVDASNCLVTQLYDSGSFTVTHCVSGDRWSTVPVPTVHTGGNPFALTFEWGPLVSGNPNPVLSTENGIANLFCYKGYLGQFPGCGQTTPTCPTWTLPPETSFIYLSDITGDTVLDDICALYGVPLSMAFPYYYSYGYLPNNLIVSVGLDCDSPTAVENTSWGHVKALYE